MTRSAKDYRQMAYNEFQAFADDLDQIIHMGKAQKMVTINGKEMYLENAAQEIKAALEINVGVKVLPLNPQRSQTPAKDFVAAILRSATQVNTYIEKADGGKPLGEVDKLLRADIRQAESVNAIRQKEQAGKMMEILNRHYGKQKVGEYYVTRENLVSRKDAVYIAQLNESLTREEIITVALNARNEDNLTKLMEGRGWGEEQVNAVLRQLRPQDVAFVNEIGDMIEELWPEIAALEKRTKGYIPAKVYGENKEFVNKDGEVLEIRGGYFPLKYDGDLSIRAGENELDAEFKNLRQGRFAAAATRRGFTKERVSNVKQPVRLDGLNVIGQHLREVVTDLTMREPIQNTNKILKTHTVRSAFQETFGANIYRDFDIWLKDTAAGQIRSARGMASAWRGIRHSTTIAAMGWKASTALVQLTGLTQSMVELRPKWVMRGLQRFSELRMDAPEFIKDRSVWIQARDSTLNRDIADALRRLQHNSVLSDVQSTFFIPLLKVQGVVDMITWLGAYEKGLSGKTEGGEGLSEAEAARYADHAVENAQGSGTFSALSPIMRGTWDSNTRLSEAVKLWTVFMSYFNTKFNVARRRTQGTNFRDGKQVVSLASDYIMLFWVETIIGDAILGRMPSGDDDDHSTFWWMLKEGITTFLAGVPLLRDVANAWAGFGGGPASARGIDTLANAGKNVKKLATGEDVNLYKLAQSAVDAGVYISPVKYPAGQIDTIIRAMERSSEGEDVSLRDYLVTPPHQ
jgi:hypothetical protein